MATKDILLELNIQFDRDTQLALFNIYVHTCVLNVWCNKDENFVCLFLIITRPNLAIVDRRVLARFSIYYLLDN